MNSKTKLIIQAICFHSTGKEVPALQKCLSKYEEKLEYEVFDWAKTRGPPPWSKQHIARVIFGSISRIACGTQKDAFFLREKEMTQEVAVALCSHVEKQIAEQPENLVEIPEPGKALAKYSSEELLALLPMKEKKLFRFRDNRGKTFTVGGEEADISLEELITIRLATDVIDIQEVRIERKGGGDGKGKED